MLTGFISVFLTDELWGEVRQVLSNGGPFSHVCEVTGFTFRLEWLDDASDQGPPQTWYEPPGSRLDTPILNDVRLRLENIMIQSAASMTDEDRAALRQYGDYADRVVHTLLMQKVERIEESRDEARLEEKSATKEVQHITQISDAEKDSQTADTIQEQGTSHQEASNEHQRTGGSGVAIGDSSCGTAQPIQDHHPNAARLVVHINIIDGKFDECTLMTLPSGAVSEEVLQALKAQLTDVKYGPQSTIQFNMVFWV